MEPINYSLQEYFKNKYELDLHSMGGWGKYEQGEKVEVKCPGTDELNKLKSDLRNIFLSYNLHIFEDVNYLKKRNVVQYSDEYNQYVFNIDENVIGEGPLIKRGLRGGLGCDVYSILDFKGFSNITPEIFLEDIKNILEKYSVKPTKAGELTKGLTSIESVFIKYIDIKTPIHMVQERQMRNNEIDTLNKMRNNEIDKLNNEIDKLNIELKQYKDLKELQSIKELIDKNKILMEENIKLVEKEDVRKKVSEWLENNARHINFKIGKTLLDIIT
jgi:hypothetical protein